MHLSLRRVLLLASNLVAAVVMLYGVAGMTGDEMRRIRKKLGLTQVEFGALVGLAPNTIARQERDEIRIREPISKLVKILATQFEFKTTRGKH